MTSMSPITTRSTVRPGTRPERYGVVRPPVAEIVTPAVDRVGPDAVVKALPDEVVHDRQLPGLQAGDGLLRVAGRDRRGRGPASSEMTSGWRDRQASQSSIGQQRRPTAVTSTRSHASQGDGGGWPGRHDDGTTGCPRVDQGSDQQRPNQLCQVSFAKSALPNQL